MNKECLVCGGPTKKKVVKETPMTKEYELICQDCGEITFLVEKYEQSEDSLCRWEYRPEEKTWTTGCGNHVIGKEHVFNVYYVCPFCENEVALK